MASARTSQAVRRPDLTAECACASIRRASRSVTQLYDVVLAPLGLKSTQFVILRILAGHGAVPQWKLAQENAVAVETLSRRLAALRKRGLVTMEIRGARGEHVYRLTESGRELLDRAIPHWNRADARLRQVLGDEPLKAMVASVQKLASAAQDAMSLKTSNRVHIVDCAR